MKNLLQKLALIGVLASLAACGAKNPSAKTPTQNLTVGMMSSWDAIPFLVASQQGYLPPNIKIEYFRSQADISSALQTGHIDGAGSDMLSLSMLTQGGVEVIATSALNVQFGVVTHPKSGINNLQDMIGKEVAISFNTSNEYTLDQIMLISGLNPNALKKVSIPAVPSRVELLKNQQIDSVLIPNPYIAIAEAGGNLVIARSNSPEFPVNPNVLYFTKATFEQKQAEIRELYKAYGKATEFIKNNDKSAFLPLTIETLSLPSAAINAPLPNFASYKLPSEEEFNQVQKWLLAKGLINQSYNYSNLVKNIYD